MTDSRIRQGLMVLGVLQLLTGLALVIAPGAFYEAIANFGSRNDHFLRDYGTYYLATGVALLMATSRPSWRVPVLFVVTIQYGLHALNHLLDIGDSDPGWVGPADFLLLQRDSYELGLGDLDAGLVYAASGSIVETTVVAGRPLMRGGVVPGAAEVLARARERAGRLGIG